LLDEMTGWDMIFFLMGDGRAGVAAWQVFVRGYRDHAWLVVTKV
jgi:hypothetical protein